MWYMMESMQQSYEMSDRLIRAISNWKAFDHPSTDDDIEHLIKSGADVNQPHGTLLPLHCACMVSDTYCLKTLLENGARINDRDGYRRTALHYAAEKDENCVMILLENGANINAPDGNGDTALHWASFKNKIECVRLLLENGANPDARDYNDDTPLSWAALKGHLQIIKMLLEYNADLCNKNLRGKTPLMQAACIQARGLNTEIDDICLQLLIKATGQFDLRNNCGDLVKDIAHDNKLREMLLPLCKNPCSLQSLCRAVIRKALGYCYLPSVVPKLPLPTQMQEILMFQR